MNVICQVHQQQVYQSGKSYTSLYKGPQSFALYLQIA